LPPTLVLLPGLDGTGKLFTELLRALDCRVASIVVPYPTDVALGYDELETLVRAALPAQGSYVLLGESFSGPLAIRIAARPPPGLVGLILSVTFASNPYPRWAWARSLAAYLPLKSLPRWGCVRPSCGAQPRLQGHPVKRSGPWHRFQAR
jgi:pimeloyl-[acyl-carrier protein] methyl ester esterase